MELFSFGLAKRLGLMGHDVTLLTAGSGRARALAIGRTRVEELRSSQVFGAPVVVDLPFTMPDADVAHIIVPNAVMATEAWLWCKSHSVPFIVSLLSIPFGHGPVSSFFSRMILPAMLADATIVHVPTLDFAKRCSASRSITRFMSKLRVIPLGVDTSRFRPEPLLGEETRRRYNCTSPVLLFTGLLTPAHHRVKGLVYLLEAVATLRKRGVDLMLMVAGDGVFKPYYMAVTKKLGIDRQVIFLSHVPNEELPKFYNACSIFILPSVRSSESFGIVVAEAMACARPVIVSDIGGLKETAAAGGVVIPPGDAGALACQIELLLRRPELAEELGERALLASRRYSWDAVAGEYESLYSLARATGEEAT